MKDLNCVLAVGILGMFAAQVQAGIITFDGTIDSAVPGLGFLV